MATISFLKNQAQRLRQDILTMISVAGSGHPGGSLSIADILAVLYWSELKHRPQHPKWPARDRFILSKGHACPALYAALAESGYFAKRELATLRKIGSRLQGHPSVIDGLPGIEVSTASLGQGLSIAAGLALGAKLDKKSWRVYCLMSDGEMEEGQIWEAAMTASHYNLDNLCGIVDVNGLQVDGSTEQVKGLGPLRTKWLSFGWEVINIDGHNPVEILEAFSQAKKFSGKPVMILAKTVKGRGVSFMENQAEWHSKAPNKEELAKALKELQ